MANESNVVVRKSIQAFLSFFTALLLFGCSENANERTEPTGTQRDILTFPVTVTLSTPSPVAPLAPVVNGSNSVSLGARAEIVNGMTVSMGNGGLQTQPDALLNETWSRGTANLRDRVRVRGTLHARTRVNGNGVVVTTWDQNPAFDPIQTLSWKVSYPTGPADNITLNAGQSRVISPGKYGTITLNSQATATFETGTYFLTSLSLQSASVLRLNQSRGPVIIYVTDGVTLRTTIIPDSGTSPPDLLIAHLGTQAIFVESLFNGALIAPSASVTFRSVTGVHTGFFYAKDPVLDAGARVQYRTPLAVIPASGKAGSSCKELAAAGGIPPADLYKYCTGCEFPLDTDRDGFEDCAESCDIDPDKQAEGICGCGTPDTDTDGDGTKNCMDPCDLDPNNTTPGQCGCLSSDPNVKAPVPAGTQCTDFSNPQTGTPTCNGAGVCGSRSTAPPGCQLVERGGDSYWFCPGPVTQSAASQACRNRGMSLVRVNEFTENEFLQRIVTKPVWIGANSITTAGTWRWSSTTSNNGDQFWAGGVTGSQRNSLFSFWGTGAPASQRCAVIRPGNGRWHAVDCNQALGYVCEFEPADTPAPPPRDQVPSEDRQPSPPMSSSCVPTQNSYLPTGPAEEDAEIAMNLHFKQAQLDAENRNYHGPAQIPPTEGSGGCELTLDPSSGIAVPNDDGWGCSFDPIPDSECTTDASCSTFGSNLLCREVKDPNDPACAQIPEGEVGENDPICTGRLRCGTLTCPGHAPGVSACQTIEVCDPADEFTLDDDEDTLEPDVPFNPGTLFESGAVPVVQPSSQYIDDPVLDQGPQGKNHKWCFMNPQADIEPAAKAGDDKAGAAKGGSKISFSFDPDLSFDADVNPLSLGETAMKVRAQAQLKTSVTLNQFLGATFTREVLSAVAAIEAERCTLRTTDTEFAVFGTDFLNIDEIPQFDTSDPDNDEIWPGDGGWFEATDRCEKTIGKAIIMANRAKKAFRDVQQLIEQFKDIKGAFSDFDNLCQNVLGLVGDAGIEVTGFPDGLVCPANEPTEITINRFLDYYQAPGFGQIAQLRQTIADLRTSTEELFKGFTVERKFGPKPFGESRTIVKGQFQIGPVPAVVEIGVFYSYGVHGYFDATFTPPFNPLEEIPDDQQDKPRKGNIARIRAGVMPFASAGVTAFVGVGKSLGPFSATLGIEGSVSLAVLRAPIFAGAGLGSEVMVDQRNLAPEVAAVLGPALNIPTHFGVPKSFKFFVWYEYGAALEANDILSGEIHGRLRIKFAFFSRTWKKRVVKFNGLPSRTVHLVNGTFGNNPGVGEGKGEVKFPNDQGKEVTSSTKTVTGTTDVGMSEAQVPLLVVQPLDVPVESVVPENDPIPFSKEFVEDMFYDNLCCAKTGEQCLMPNDLPQPGGPVPCCPGSVCEFDVSGQAGSTICVVDCKPPGESCTSTDQCCTAQGTDTACTNDVCTQCTRTGFLCQETSECCGADTDPLIFCDDDTNRCARVCEETGGACTEHADCCPGQQLACGAAGTCCGVTADGWGTGGSCDQDSDCCDFTGQDSEVGCVEGPFGHECAFFQ